MIRINILLYLFIHTNLVCQKFGSLLRLLLLATREMGAGPISGGAAGLIAVACSTRRWRLHVGPLLASALPTGVVEKALMVSDAVSAARSDGVRDAGGELVCFIGTHAPPLERPSFSSSSIHPKPGHVWLLGISATFFLLIILNV